MMKTSDWFITRKSSRVEVLVLGGAAQSRCRQTRRSCVAHKAWAFRPRYTTDIVFAPWRGAALSRSGSCTCMSGAPPARRIICRPFLGLKAQASRTRQLRRPQDMAVHLCSHRSEVLSSENTAHPRGKNDEPQRIQSEGGQKAESTSKATDPGRDQGAILESP